jgi:hypothetical protein
LTGAPQQADIDRRQRYPFTPMTAPENDRTDFIQPESVGKGGGVAAPAVPAPPPQLGKYPLRELVGAGSIGVVYKSPGPDSKR